MPEFKDLKPEYGIGYSEIYQSTLSNDNKLTLFDSNRPKTCWQKVYDLASCFSILTTLQEAMAPRHKNEEDRELNFFAGLYFFSFLFSTVCLTSLSLSIGWFTDLLQVFGLQGQPMAVYIQFIEMFPFLSTFFTVYKCLRIMEAKGCEMTRADYCKVVAKKFLRLAPCYYICWLLVYAF